MRNDQTGLPNNQVSVKNNIDVEGSGGLQPRSEAVVRLFDRKGGLQDLPGTQIRLRLNHSVQEPRLIRNVLGFSLVNSSDPQDFDNVRGQTLDSFVQVLRALTQV